MKHLLPTIVLFIACILSSGITYELTMYRVARQCIASGGWSHAFHKYQCRQVI